MPKAQKKNAKTDSSESENNNSEVENNNDDETEELKENVVEFLKIDDLIRQKKEEIKELTEKKNEYSEFIQNYLEKANIPKIETKDGEIVFKKQTTKAPIKETLIETAIVNKFENIKQITESGSDIAREILDTLNEMRGITVKNSIRRIVKKRK